MRRMLGMLLTCALTATLASAEERLPAGVPGRLYHHVPVSLMRETSHTHVCVIGRVTAVKREPDGDIHICIDGPCRPGCATCLIAEIIPRISLKRPAVGERVRLCGISRMDTKHDWPEVHPVESWNTIDP